MGKGRLSLVVFEAIQRKNEHEGRNLFRQWRFLELFAALFSIFGILSASAEYEYSFAETRTHENCHDNPHQDLRFITLGFTGISIGMLICRHRVKTDWRNKRPLENIRKNGNAFVTHKKVLNGRLVIEIIILLVFPYPFIERKIEFQQPSIKEKNEKWSNLVPLCYNLSEFLYVFMFVRLFFIVRALFNFTPYQDDHARYYCSKLKTRANLRFTLRIMMITHPFLIIYCISVLTFVVIGIIVRVFERPYSDVSGLNFESFENSIYNTAIYMSTVGYGDLYPSTTLGRGFAVIGTFWGAFVFSMIVFTFQTMLHLDPYQKRAYLSIKQTRAATRVVVYSLYLNLMKKKYPNNSKEVLKTHKEMSKRLEKFRSTIKKLKKVDTFIEEGVNRTRFARLFNEVGLMHSRLDQLIAKSKNLKIKEN